MLDWAEAWGHDVYVVNQTASLGAINVAGPQARELLQKLSSDPLDKESFPYIRHRQITVAGMPCLAMRLGFVGELAYELHFPASRSEELWSAILEAGEGVGHRGRSACMAQRLLRLEKGHIIVSQDTDFETTPWKIGMGGRSSSTSPTSSARPRSCAAQDRDDRELLVPWSMPGAACPPEGPPCTVDGKLAGRVTSAWDSPRSAMGSGSRGCRRDAGRRGAAARSSAQRCGRAVEVRRASTTRRGEAPCLISGRFHGRGQGALLRAEGRRSTRLQIPAGVERARSRPNEVVLWRGDPGRRGHPRGGGQTAARGRRRARARRRQHATAGCSSRSSGMAARTRLARLLEACACPDEGLPPGQGGPACPARSSPSAGRIDVLCTSDVRWYVRERLLHSGARPWSGAEATPPASRAVSGGGTRNERPLQAEGVLARAPRCSRATKSSSSAPACTGSPPPTSSRRTTGSLRSRCSTRDIGRRSQRTQYRDHPRKLPHGRRVPFYGERRALRGPVARPRLQRDVLARTVT